MYKCGEVQNKLLNPGMRSVAEGVGRAGVSSREQSNGGWMPHGWAEKTGLPSREWSRDDGTSGHVPCAVQKSSSHPHNFLTKQHRPWSSLFPNKSTFYLSWLEWTFPTTKRSQTTAEDINTHTIGRSFQVSLAFAKADQSPQTHIHLGVSQANMHESKPIHFPKCSQSQQTSLISSHLFKVRNLGIIFDFALSFASPIQPITRPLKGCLYPSFRLPLAVLL